MGDRISISFRNGERESITFFSHWNGRSLLEKVEEFYKELSDHLEGWDKWSVPLSRLEPDTVIINFIVWGLGDSLWIDSNYYLGKNQYDGDNSDNGHWVFDLQKGKWEY
jgi:hypothetical protein